MRSLGMEPMETQLEGMVRALDEDNNGTIEFSEFIVLMRMFVTKQNKEEDMQEPFKIFDRNGDGHINADDFKNFMNALGEKLTNEDLDDLFMHASSDGRGLLTYDDFIAMLKIE